MTVVDVIIAARDPGPFLHAALESLQAQTLPDWSAIVVDDGSTEDLSWVDSIDPRIHLLRQPGSGLSVARNTGIAAGSAPLVAFLDSDDVWLASKLAAQVAAMSADVSVVSTAFEMINESGTRIGGGFQGYASSRSEVLQGNGICVSTVIVRREQLLAVGCFDPQWIHVQDWALWLRLSAVGKLVKLPETLAQYRIHDFNMSKDYVGFYRESAELLRGHLAGDDRPWARIGLKRVRHLAGVKALDAFRLSREPRHLGRALLWSPRYTSRAITRKILPRWRHAS